MSRTLSTNLTTEIAKTQDVHPRTLAVLYLDGGTLRLTSHESDVVFQGNTYTARKIAHSPIKTFFSNKVDNCNLTIDNVDLGMSAYYATDRFAGKKADIYKIFLDANGNTIDGQKNLLTNPKMETTTSWLASHSGALAVESNAASVGGSFPGDNTACLKGTVAAGQVSGLIYQAATLSLNTAYTVQFYCYIPATVAVGDAVIKAYYSSGGWQTIAAETIAERDQWVLKTLTFTSNAAVAAHIIAVGISNGSPGDIAYACRGMLETGSAASTWGLPTDDDKILQFSGYMDTPRITEQSMSVRIVSIFDRAKSKAPWRFFQSQCNWDFCGTQCTYNSGSKVRGTADSGTTLGLTDTALVGISSMVGAIVKVLSGTNKGAVRYIATHNTVTGAITWTTAMTSACDGTTQYLIECDKSKSTCTGFSNQVNFGGFSEKPSYDKYPYRTQFDLSWLAEDEGGRWDARKVDSIAQDMNPIPLIYGTSLVPGKLVALGRYEASTYYQDTRIYAFCEGEIDSATIYVNGTELSLADTAKVRLKTGAAGQSLAEADMVSWDLDASTYYFKGTVFVCIKSVISPLNGGSAVSNYYFNLFHRDPSEDQVFAKVTGLKVQKYLADGSPDGAAAWDDNPIWSIVDFALNRSMQPLTSAQIGFSKTKTAADLCDTLGYRLNLVVAERTDESMILDWMLTSCRGFLTYTAGQMEANIETTGSVQHAFTMANIIRDSFEGPFEEEVNDRPNRVIVKYVDEEIRENVALSTGNILPGVNITSLAYSDKQGTFPASGTVYVGQEAVAYTVDSGSALTINWTPVRFYQKGYPIFEGKQLFPEKTAVYNDWDHQDDVGRVIDKEIDGRAIPTYEQASKIAEYIGREEISGNVFVRFQGMMDSLAITVGDISSITHDVPAWTAEEFRIIEASETQDEEVAYLCKVYDASLYEQNRVSPAPILRTTLPNPYALIGQCSSVIVTEGGHAGPDGTYVPTLTVTYTLPSVAIFWHHAIIQVKVNAGSYVTYGEDYSRGAGYVIEGPGAGFKKGDTVYARVISVSERGDAADAATAPTDSTTIAATVITLDTPTNLVLEGGGTAWNGRRFAVSWDAQGTGDLDPSYVTNEVVIVTGGIDRISFFTKNNRWEYVYGDGIAAGLDPYIVTANGALTVKVRRTSTLVSSSSYATLALTNATPTNPQNAVIQALPRGAQLTWDKSTESDFKEFQVRTKISAGGTFSSWTPIQDNIYVRMLTEAEIVSYGRDAAIYFEAKTVDLYGNESTSTAANVTAIYYGIVSLDVDTITVDKLAAGSITSKSIVLAIAAGTGDCEIRAGIATGDFANAGAASGFILGLDDSDSDKPKLYIGDATKYIKFDGVDVELGPETKLAGDTVSLSMQQWVAQLAASNWTERSNPKNFRLYDIAWSGSLFVAVGAPDGTDAYIVTSPDGSTWTERSNPKNFNLLGVTWSGSLFVAVGYPDGGDAYIVTSPNGTAWTERSNPKNFVLYDVTWNGSLFVAVGYVDGSDAYIVTSPDGTTWTERSNPKNATLRGVTWNGSLFVAVGESDGGDAYIITSPDGIAWTERSNPKNFTLYSVTWNGSLFVAVGYPDGTDSYIITSPDGTTWTERSNPKNHALYDIAWNGFVFVAAGAGDSSDAYMITSFDGTTWVEESNPKKSYITGITWDDRKFIAVGETDATDAYILTSLNI